MYTGPEGFLFGEGATNPARPGRPIDLKRNVPMLKFDDHRDFNHLYRANDRDSVPRVVSWLHARGFDTYLTGSVVSAGLVSAEDFGKRNYNDIDLVAMTPVGGAKGNGMLTLLDDLLLADDAVFDRVFTLTGGIEYGVKPNASEPVPGSSARLRYTLRPHLILPSGNPSKKKFSPIDLSFENRSAWEKYLVE